MKLKKKCSKCKQMKELGLFGNRKGSADGLQSWCKACRAESTRHWRKTDNGRKRNNEAKSRYDRRAVMFHTLMAPLTLLVADMEAARGADRAYRLAKRALEKVRDADVMPRIDVTARDSEASGRRG